MTFRDATITSFGVLAWALTTILAIRPAIAEQTPRSPRVTKIVVIAPRTIDRQAIIDRSGIRVGKPLDPAMLEAARRRLAGERAFEYQLPDRRLLIVYADVKDDRATVTIEMHTALIVRDIRLSDTGPIPASRIRALIKTRIGVEPDRRTLERDVAAIKAAYEREGYVAAVRVDGVDEDNILRFSIVVGRIHDIRIVGLSSAWRRGLRYQLEFKPGDYFNARQVERKRKELARSGPYANVQLQTSTPEIGQIDLTWSLAGAGSSPEDNRVLDALLADVVSYRQGGGTTAERSKIVFDKNGFERFTTNNPNVIVDDLSRFAKELSVARAKPDYLIELDQSIWWSIFERLFPRCAGYICCTRPEYREHTKAIVWFLMGSGPHGLGNGRYILANEHGSRP